MDWPLSGCSPLLNPFSCCSAVPLCNTTGGCAVGRYWCHLLEACVPVISPCSPYDQSPAARARFSYSLPPRYPATPPFYHLVADLPLRMDTIGELTTVRVGRLYDVQYLDSNSRSNCFFNACIWEKKLISDV